MNTVKRTAAATKAAQFLVDLGIDRREMGLKAKLLVLGFAAQNGLITEPESKILLGRAGMLKRYSGQGYLKQFALPPGLKSAPHFPHLHYYHLTEKGMMLVSMHMPHLSRYGNLELKQRTYLHDFIVRIEAAWRIRVCEISSYIPESRLLERGEANKKRHDGHFVLLDGIRVGLEVEAADWKSGDKLAQFASQCLNSITTNQVQQVLVLVQTDKALQHYTAPFLAGQIYYPQWIKESGRWWPRKVSKTIISTELSAKVKVELIRSEWWIKDKVTLGQGYYMPIGEDEEEID